MFIPLQYYLLSVECFAGDDTNKHNVITFHLKQQTNNVLQIHYDQYHKKKHKSECTWYIKNK